jgi:hypothetical protein
MATRCCRRLGGGDDRPRVIMLTAATAERVDLTLLGGEDSNP